jgi:hypothetical protein
VALPARDVIQALKPKSRIMRYELSDYEWTAIKPMLPNKRSGAFLRCGVRQNAANVGAARAANVFDCLVELGLVATGDDHIADRMSACGLTSQEKFQTEALDRCC